MNNWGSNRNMKRLLSTFHNFRKNLESSMLEGVEFHFNPSFILSSKLFDLSIYFVGRASVSFHLGICVGWCACMHVHLCMKTKDQLFSNLLFEKWHMTELRVLSLARFPGQRTSEIFLTLSHQVFRLQPRLPCLDFYVWVIVIQPQIFMSTQYALWQLHHLLNCIGYTLSL